MAFRDKLIKKLDGTKESMGYLTRQCRDLSLSGLFRGYNFGKKRRRGRKEEKRQLIRE